VRTTVFDENLIRALCSANSQQTAVINFFDFSTDISQDPRMSMQISPLFLLSLIFSTKVEKLTVCSDRRRANEEP
jgi:hypothetical protein